MKRTVTPPVTLYITDSYDAKIRNIVKTIIEVYELQESKISRNKVNNLVENFALEYDEFQQIYASLHVELENRLRELQQIPRSIDNTCIRIRIADWFEDVNALISLLQDFREAERGYLSARLTLARNLLFDETGKEGSNE